MKITLTLDDDVAAMLHHAQAKSAVDIKQLANELLRTGLKKALHAKRPRKRYRTPSTHAGDCLIDPFMKIEDMLDTLP